MTAHSPTVLVVDDDTQIVRFVQRALQNEGYATVAAGDGASALECMAKETPDLVLLDVMMPILDGFAVCEQIRSDSAVPIIMMTARESDTDRITGLDLGADDYLTKPFNIDELLARVRAVLRRSAYSQGVIERGMRRELKIGPFTIDLALQEVWRNDIPLRFTPVEYRLFVILMQNADRVLTVHQLLERVWGENAGESFHIVQVNINRLRNKIEPDPAHPQFLLTKRGFGYCFVAPASPVSVGKYVGSQRHV